MFVIQVVVVVVTIVLMILPTILSLSRSLHLNKYRYHCYRINTLLYSSNNNNNNNNINNENVPLSISVHAKLQSMHTSELKEFLKKLGGTPRNLRKAQLVEECGQLIEKGMKSIDNDDNNNNNNNVDSSNSNSDNSNSDNSNTESNNIINDGSRSNSNNVIVNEYGRRQYKGITTSSAASKRNYSTNKNNESNESNSNLRNNNNNNNSNKQRIKMTAIDNDSKIFKGLEGIDTKIINWSKSELDFKGYVPDSNNPKYNNIENVFEGSDHKYPIGSNRDDRLELSGGTDMEISFLGTASCIPSITRGVSCVAFRYCSDIWLFDCGEASQIQVQKSRIRASKIKKIFLSHAHGDHSFGLPGILCLMGQSTQDERGKVDDVEPVDIYGPEGTRDLVRSMIQLTYSRVVPPYRIHELKKVPYLHGKCVKWRPQVPQVRTSFSSFYGEQEGSEDIYPDEKGHYHLFDEGELSVMAAPMQHTIPCVGYIIKEKMKPGRLKFDDVKESIEKNKELLKVQLGLRDANKIYGILKMMKSGDIFTLPDGHVIKADDVLDPPRLGRKIVIMGDTCSGDLIAPLAEGADLLIHEATNAWIREFDQSKYSNYVNLEKDTFLHGHSTPQMAGSFAQRIRAKKLILTHFSPRYKGDDSEQSMRIMWRLEEMAREACHLKNPNDIIAAWDQMVLPIWANEPHNNNTNNTDSNTDTLPNDLKIDNTRMNNKNDVKTNI